MAQITLLSVRRNKKVRRLIHKADEVLGIIGYTEHGKRHANWTAKVAQMVLSELKLNSRQSELAGIAAYLHDIGNVINRDGHAQTGAIIAYNVLGEMDMDIEEAAEIVGAIGNHHEEHCDPVSAVGAALILADKADVHRSRVRNPDMIKFDIHDRVNYAAEASALYVEPNDKRIRLNLTIDTQISQLMEYFEIFLSRMVVSRRAADFLGCAFELFINDNRMM